MKKSIAKLTKDIKNMKISKEDKHDHMDSESTVKKSQEKSKSKEKTTTSTLEPKKTKKKDKAKPIETKSKTKAKTKSIKVPPENDSLRIFYVSLLKQNPASAMARKWCMDHGLLDEE